MEALVEVPRGGFVKWELHGGRRVDFVSPLPCPFNYGCVPALPADDGDPVDAVVLGPRLPRGTRIRLPVVAVVHFRDGPHPDPKWVLSARTPSPACILGIQAFFEFYARARTLLRRLAGRRRRVVCEGVERVYRAAEPSGT